MSSISVGVRSFNSKVSQGQRRSTSFNRSRATYRWRSVGILAYLLHAISIGHLRLPVDFRYRPGQNVRPLSRVVVQALMYLSPEDLVRIL
jgi:hypothetical protein